MPIANTRKLVAVLFADIVSYTAMMQQNEAQALTFLEKFKTALVKQVGANQGQIIQFYGDGCLCIFDSSIDALTCAKELQTIFQTTPKVPVRIGLNAGEVIFKEANVFGNAVNIASRVESLGIAGAVLFTENIYQQIKNQPAFSTTSLGQFEFKNVAQPIKVYALANEGFPVPKRKEITGKLKTPTPQKTTWRLPALVAALLAFAGIFWYANQQKTPIAAQIAPSIAILPFKDLSPNKDQEYFGDGIAEEILNTLAQLNELKVAGRTSSFSFKDKESTISSIGEALKVNHVLEGSVRKQNDKIRVTAQLIKVADGFQVWSDRYDRVMDDIFALQDELAQDIGEVLLDKLAPEQKAKLTTQNTPNSEVYELFLKAKHIHKNIYNSSLALSDFHKSEQLFMQAIVKDSTYALAHAGLADLYDSFWLRIPPADTLEKEKYLSLMQQESQIALKRNPEIAYVQQVNGYVLSRLGETDKAFQHFVKSYEISPKNPESIIGLANLYLSAGLHKDALTFANKTVEIDPLFPSGLTMQIYCNFYLNNWEKTVELCQAFLDINPHHQVAQEYLFRSYFLLDKQTEALATLAEIEKTDPFVVEKLGLDLEIALLQNNEDDIHTFEELHNPNMDFVIHYFHADFDAAQKAYQTATEDYLSFANTPPPYQGSFYLDLSTNPRFEPYKMTNWFQEVLNLEKKKYDYLLEKYPNASQVLQE